MWSIGEPKDRKKEKVFVALDDVSWRYRGILNIKTLLIIIMKTSENNFLYLFKIHHFLKTQNICRFAVVKSYWFISILLLFISSNMSIIVRNKTNICFNIYIFNLLTNVQKYTNSEERLVKLFFTITSRWLFTSVQATYMR